MERGQSSQASSPLASSLKSSPLKSSSLGSSQASSTQITKKRRFARSKSELIRILAKSSIITPISWIDVISFDGGKFSILVEDVEVIEDPRNKLYFKLKALHQKQLITWKFTRTDKEISKFHKKFVAPLSEKTTPISFPLPCQEDTRKLAEKKMNPMRSQSWAVKPDLKEEATKWKEPLRAYFKEILALPEILLLPEFKQLVDPRHRPSTFFLLEEAVLQENLVLKEKYVFCLLFGVNVFVYSSASDKGPVSVIDISCASIDLAKQDSAVFEIRLERGKKMYSFKTPGEESCFKWISHCRLSRIQNRLTTDLLAISKSLNIEEEKNVYTLPTQNINGWISSARKPAYSIVHSMMGSNKLLTSSASKINLNLNTNSFTISREEDKESNLKKSVNGSIIAASKDKLFEKLFVGLLKKEVFINTYPLFSTRQEFMNYIIEWFTSEKLHKDPKELSEIRAHIMEILYLWLTMFPGDFRNDDIIKALQVLASTPIEAVEGHIKQFQKLLVDKLNPQISTEGINSPPSILPTHFQPKQFTIVDIHPTEIARQLTLASMKIFSLINPRDLLYWNSKAEEKKLRIMDFINNFNYLCQWAISFILVGINEKQRGFFITHVIYVMIEAFSIGNYHCAVALLACLDGVAISRLKKSWCFVEETQINSLENIRNQLSANGNWKIYRELVQQRQDPCLPYIGVYLQDIFFIEDGNPSTSGELFNFEKMTQFSNCLQEIMRFFYIKYDFKSVPEIQETINSIKVFELKETHRISLTVEPREESVL